MKCGMRNSECGMNDEIHQLDIDQIKAIIAEKSQRYQSKMGDVAFAGVEGGTVKIAPSGFCWR